jgi:hypothetical protein
LSIFSGQGLPTPTLTITAEGQAALGKARLKTLGVRPRGKISADKLPDGRIEVKPMPRTGEITMQSIF